MQSRILAQLAYLYRSHKPCYDVYGARPDLFETSEITAVGRFGVNAHHAPGLLPLQAV